MEAGANKRIVVIDDHPLIRFAFTQLIDKESNLTCCGQADGADSGIEMVKELNPDLVVLDLGLGDGDGFKVLDALKKEIGDISILICSRHTDPLLAERGLHAGANGFISKEEPPRSSSPQSRPFWKVASTWDRSWPIGWHAG